MKYGRGANGINTVADNDDNMTIGLDYIFARDKYN